MSIFFTRQTLRPAFFFAAFVFWLLAIPMNGPLTAAAGITEATRYFLLPHVGALALIGGFCPRHLYVRVAPVAVLLSIILSLILVLLPDYSHLLLPLLSISGAFVALRACCRLHDTTAPLACAAAGLIMANLALLLLQLLPEHGFLPVIVATLPLLLLLLPSPDVPPVVDESFKLWHYLPFIFVFHVVSGLMYAVIYPAYQHHGLPAGIELPFYISAVIGALFLVRISREMALVLGVLLGMAAFVMLQWESPEAVAMSLFFLQAGQGFVDLFLLAFLLGFSNPLRAFGFGLATLCLGIYGGQLVGEQMLVAASPIAMFGHLFLNLAVLTLYLVNRRRSADLVKLADAAKTITADDSLPEANRIPDSVGRQLSEREHLVLSLSLDGSTYRDIADQLNISESTVKTYMKRICDKLGVRGRKGLMAFFHNAHQQPPKEVS